VLHPLQSSDVQLQAGAMFLVAERSTQLRTQQCRSMLSGTWKMPMLIIAGHMTDR
jgi:hypothetical protein